MLKESSKQHGFSLVELVMTLVILGVIAAVSLPKFYNQSTFDERYFHDDLLSAARYSQRLATGSGCAVRLSVSGAGFSLTQDANCDLSSPSYSLAVVRPSDSEPFVNTSVPSSLTIVAAEANYFFMPEGAAVDNGGTRVGDSTITLTSSAGSALRTINIIGDTGYVFSN